MSTKSTKPVSNAQRYTSGRSTSPDHSAGLRSLTANFYRNLHDLLEDEALPLIDDHVEASPEHELRLELKLKKLALSHIHRPSDDDLDVAKVLDQIETLLLEQGTGSSSRNITRCQDLEHTIQECGSFIGGSRNVSTLTTGNSHEQLEKRNTWNAKMQELMESKLNITMVALDLAQAETTAQAATIKELENKLADATAHLAESSNAQWQLWPMWRTS